MADKSFMDVKVKELPAFVGENLRGETMRTNWTNFASRYTSKYFGKAGRARPVIHVMLLVGLIGYTIEYPHLKKHDVNRKYH